MKRLKFLILLLAFYPVLAVAGPNDGGGGSFTNGGELLDLFEGRALESVDPRTDPRFAGLRAIIAFQKNHGIIRLGGLLEWFTYSKKWSFSKGKADISIICNDTTMAPVAGGLKPAACQDTKMVMVNGFRFSAANSASQDGLLLHEAIRAWSMEINTRRQQDGSAPLTEDSIRQITYAIMTVPGNVLSIAQTLKDQEYDYAPYNGVNSFESRDVESDYKQILLSRADIPAFVRQADAEKKYKCQMLAANRGGLYDHDGDEIQKRAVALMATLPLPAAISNFKTLAPFLDDSNERLGRSFIASIAASNPMFAKALEDVANTSRSSAVETNFDGVCSSN